MSPKLFNYGGVTRRILPFKALKNCAAQPLDLNRMLDLIAWGARENLLEAVSFSDDDVLKWFPDSADDFKDKNNSLWNRLADIKNKLDNAGVLVHAITCDLTSNFCFAHGAFTNNDAKVRELAAKKADRAAAIGHFFNASVYIFDGDSEGFDSPFTVSWKEAWKRLCDGLDGIATTIVKQNMTNYHGACIATKSSGVYLYGFLGTLSAAMNVISQLKSKDFWGVIPSTSQLLRSGWENAPAELASAALAGNIAFLKVGGGTIRPIKRAPHPIIGTANLKETVQMFWLLDKVGWKGSVEYDNIVSLSDAKCNSDDVTCKQFIANCANALTIALQLAEKIKVDELSSLTPSEADLMSVALIGGLNIDQVILRSIKKIEDQQPANQQQQPANQQPAQQAKPEQPSQTGENQQQGKNNKQQKQFKQKQKQNHNGAPAPANQANPSEPNQPQRPEQESAPVQTAQIEVIPPPEPVPAPVVETIPVPVAEPLAAATPATAPVTVTETVAAPATAETPAAAVTPAIPETPAVAETPEAPSAAVPEITEGPETTESPAAEAVTVAEPAEDKTADIAEPTLILPEEKKRKTTRGRKPASRKTTPAKRSPRKKTTPTAPQA